MFNIFIANNDKTVKYAARELAKYLTLITKNVFFKIVYKNQYDSNLNGIWLLNSDELNINFQIENAYLDDAIKIDIKNANGYIAGSNYRSILIGVYKFLEILGCKFLRPGKDGEIIVHKNLEELNANLTHISSLRHRGIVIEGANKYENVLDLIDWLPKVGFNSYFMQFKYGYIFFKQWYAHTNNPYKQKEFFDDDMAIEFTENIAQEIKKRGLLYHAVGHGFTCETVGVVGKGWENEKVYLKDEKKEFLALINGKREFFGNVPINTNLCNSSKKVQEAFAKTVLECAKEYNYVDILHVWLADAFNNHCECENCKKLTPTDWYVECLNLIDEMLTKENINTKIAFLLYFELLWPPIKSRLKNPNRFLLMFAPITRTFTSSYEKCLNSKNDILEFELNKIKLPSKVEDYIAYLKKWQEIFKGDSFDFDYHLGKAHYGDAGYLSISKIISDDIKNLKNLGLNGLLSCQEQRCFFPIALPNYIMGKTLWDTSLLFEDLANEYFSSAFGKDWEICKKYLEEISNSFDTDYWHLRHNTKDEKVYNDLDKIPEIIEKFKDTCLKNQNHINETEKLSWKYILYHLEYVLHFSNALKFAAIGDKDKANENFIKFRDFICKNEDELQRALDVFRVLMIGKNSFEFNL